MTDEQAKANGEAFMKVAALAALHIQATNSAISDGNLEAAKAGVEFGEKVAKGILDTVPENVAVGVMLELLSSVLGV